jgi:hypothetical protein
MSDDFAGFFENSAYLFYQHIISTHFVKLFQKEILQLLRMSGSQFTVNNHRTSFHSTFDVQFFVVFLFPSAFYLLPLPASA